MNFEKQARAHEYCEGGIIKCCLCYLKSNLAIQETIDSRRLLTKRVNPMDEETVTGTEAEIEISEPTATEEVAEETEA